MILLFYIPLNKYMLFMFVARLLVMTEEAGGLFDFNATLPLMAIQFVLLMIVLTFKFYIPISKNFFERQAYIALTADATDALNYKSCQNYQNCQMCFEECKNLLFNHFYRIRYELFEPFEIIPWVYAEPYWSVIDYCRDLENVGLTVLREGVDLIALASAGLKVQTTFLTPHFVRPY